MTLLTASYKHQDSHRRCSTAYSTHEALARLKKVLHIDDCVASIDSTNTVTTYHRDRQFNTIGLTDATATVVNLCAYTPYGDFTVTDSAGAEVDASTVDNEYWYTGRRLDKESGLWYFRARYFSSEMGTFVSRDPIGMVDGAGLYNGYFAMVFSSDAFGLFLGETKDCTFNNEWGWDGEWTYVGAIPWGEVTVSGEGSVADGITLRWTRKYWKEWDCSCDDVCDDDEVTKKKTEGTMGYIKQYQRNLIYTTTVPSGWAPIPRASSFAEWFAEIGGKLIDFPMPLVPEDQAWLDEKIKNGPPSEPASDDPNMGVVDKAPTATIWCWFWE